MGETHQKLTEREGEGDTPEAKRERGRVREIYQKLRETERG